MISPVAPGRVQVTSPVRGSDLRDLDAGVTSVQFHQALSPQEHALLGSWASDRPRLGLRVFGNYRRDVQDLEFLQHYPRLGAFGIDTMHGREPADLSGLRHLPDDLGTLRLGVRSPGGADLATLSRLTRLHTFALAAHRRLPPFLADCPELHELSVEGPVADLAAIGRLTTLERLTLRSVDVRDLRSLVGLDRLDTLVVNLGGGTDLHHLPAIGRLRHLALWQVRGLADLSALGELEQLETLRLQSLRQVSSLPDLSRLTHLHTIHLETMKGLTDLGPLASAPALRVLRLVGAGHLEPADLSPLVGHPTLQRVGLGLGSTRKNRAAVELVGLPDA